MAPKNETTGTRYGGHTACAPLGHPLRVRILEIANTRDISPAAFVDEGLQPAGVTFANRPAALSHVAYHFRALEKAGCIEVVRTAQRRGATEHIYRGTAPVEFSSEEFDRMAEEQRQLLSRTSLQALVARADGAMRAGTFDSRTNRHLIWMVLELDEKGWEDFAGAQDDCFDRVQEIHAESKDRLAESGKPAIPTTYGALGFESPPPPPLPAADPTNGQGAPNGAS
jgi:hypothetical protein